MQGDSEVALGLPIFPLMDCSKSYMPCSQISSENPWAPSSSRLPFLSLLALGAGALHQNLHVCEAEVRQIIQSI